MKQEILVLKIECTVPMWLLWCLLFNGTSNNKISISQLLDCWFLPILWVIHVSVLHKLCDFSAWIFHREALLHHLSVRMSWNRQSKRTANSLLLLSVLACLWRSRYITSLPKVYIILFLHIEIWTFQAVYVRILLCFCILTLAFFLPKKIPKTLPTILPQIKKDKGKI